MSYFSGRMLYRVLWKACCVLSQRTKISMDAVYVRYMFQLLKECMLGEGCMSWVTLPRARRGHHRGAPGTFYFQSPEQRQQLHVDAVHMLPPWLRKRPLNKNRCWSCDVQGARYQKCSGCGMARYCGASCQRINWRAHSGLPVSGAPEVIRDAADALASLTGQPAMGHPAVCTSVPSSGGSGHAVRG